MNMLELMAAPFAECLILVAIHTYLGIHVLRRRVIFVDLALAQTAALGTTVGFMFGIVPDTPAALIYSITFTFVAAAIFALTRLRGERVPQEAVIGLFYALTASVAVLVVQKTQGAEHLDSILVGGLLWVEWSDVISALIAYSLIGAIHVVFGRQFRLISNDPAKAYERGMNVRAWDFLFYLTFGFVISFSVRVAGVLLVFVFLVAPAIMAFMITDRLKWQLIVGWSMGTIVTTIGMLISYWADLPSGPTVVSFYGVVLAIGALALYVIKARRTGRALGWVALGVAVAAAISLAVYGEGLLLGGSSLATDEELVAVQEEMERVAKKAHQRAIIEENSEVARLEREVGGAVSASSLVNYIELEDSESRLEFIRREIDLHEKNGLPLLICFLSDPETGIFFRAEALGIIEERLGEDFGYDPEREPDQNSAALNRIREAIAAL
ncbi:MAG: metal ABC transporter permease [Polyangia bacterium]